jgi:hypothetical protein
MAFDVLSPDGFSISRDEVFATYDIAMEKYNQWKKNFERQGYYSSNKYGRIPLEDLDDCCEVIEFDEEVIDENVTDEKF